MHNKILKSLPLSIWKRYIKNEIANTLEILEKIISSNDKLEKTQFSKELLHERRIQLLNMSDSLSMKKFKPGYGYWLIDEYEPTEDLFHILTRTYNDYTNTLP